MIVTPRILAELEQAWREALPMAYEDGLAFIKISYDKDKELHIQAANHLDLDRLIVELQAIKKDYQNLPLFLTET